MNFITKRKKYIPGIVITILIFLGLIAFLNQGGGWVDWIGSVWLISFVVINFLRPQRFVDKPKIDESTYYYDLLFIFFIGGSIAWFGGAIFSITGPEYSMISGLAPIIIILIIAFIVLRHKIYRKE